LEDLKYLYRYKEIIQIADMDDYLEFIEIKKKKINPEVA